jgi:hypothetical protein
MAVSHTTQPPWLFLVFTLPTRLASQRVEIWRKLQKYGTLALPSAGHLLPNSPANLERMEWLATTIRGYKGQASVVEVQSFDDMPAARLRQLFLDARALDYRKLHTELNKLRALPAGKRSAAVVLRLRRRFAEILEIDFFRSPLRARVESVLAKLEQPSSPDSSRKVKAATYVKRTWMTRPRPGIDRVSSAWLIGRFIDPKARFLFAADPATHPDAIPFDMFCTQGFGHRGEDCTFETLYKQFAIRNSRVKRIAEMVHDADLGDEKFGRAEALGLDKVLNGWAKQGISDHELLKRGIELIEGLYHSLA